MSSSSNRDLRLLLELGRGGMGIVYLALQRGPAGFAKLKVVKRLRPDLATEPAAVAMFLEEGRLSARLNHPNVVQTNEVGFDGEHYTLEMEYLEGQTLEALTSHAARAGGLSIALGVYVLARALAGLDYAHELKDHDGAPLRVVHRDVSPHNVFVTYDGQVKLLDFGIAKAADSQHETQTGVVKGKVTYMAPEQIARKRVDRRVDVFAAGVILWQILAGERLWKDVDGFEIFLKLRSEDVPSPSRVRPIDPALEAICMRALARDPDARFATAAEMQRALDAWLDAADDRVGPREVAETMASLFATARAAAKKAVDDAIRGAQTGETPIVPQLSQPPALAPVGTNPGTASTLDGGARVRQARELRGMRALAVVSVGIALVASAATGLLVLRRRAAARAAPNAHASNASVAGCATNADCDASKLEICRARRCAPLETDRCKVHAEPSDVADDRTIWIGAMFPMTGSLAEAMGMPDTHALDLARRDFFEATRGIPSRSSAPPRPFAFLVCDDADDRRASALHLANDVGVPAVIGFSASAEAIELSRDVFIPRGIFVATTNSGDQVTQVLQPRDGPRLVWRTTPASALGAVPAARVVSDVVEPRLRAAGIVGDAKPMRVALIRPKTQYGLSLSDAVVKNLAFNGRPSIANGDDFEQIVFDDPNAPSAHPDFAGVVRRLVDGAPHAILFAGEDELVANVFAPTERAWRAKGHRPTWISATNLEGDALFSFLGKDASLRRRFFGVSSPESTTSNAQLAVHYSSEFEKVTPNDTPASAYDAAYLLAYAAYAVGDAPIDGRALASAVARLVPPGARVDVGPAHVFEAVDALRRGANVDLTGADTTLDFDLATGEPTVEWVVQCVGVGATGAAEDAIESGVTFDTKTGRLVGRPRCR